MDGLISITSSILPTAVIGMHSLQIKTQWVCEKLKELSGDD